MAEKDGAPANALKENDEAQIDKTIAEIGQKLPLQREEDVLSRQETEVLELYAELRELELEQAILEAEVQVDSGDDAMDVDVVDAALRKAQKDLLEARASYEIRQSVIDGVLQADPVLKAVHTGLNTNPSARTLNPMLNQRDVLAMCYSSLSRALRDTLDATTLEEVKNLDVMEENRRLAAELFELTDELKERRLNDLEDVELLASLKTAEANAREARRQYRFIKGVIGGVIAGSGIDWSQDEDLRNFVLDFEE